MTHAKQYHITVIGCGKMGGALIQGWVESNLLKQADILDPNGIDDTLTHHKMLFPVKSMAELDLQRTDLVILSVKPQIMDQICADLKDHLPSGTPVLSIAAGKSIAYFQKHLNADTPIIRTMPNTPAAIAKGITALVATDNVSDADKTMADDLMRAVGQTIWVEDENLMNAVTAVSGSGPAYVFHLIEAMAAAGAKMGLPEHQAMQLARQTVIGAGALATDQTDVSAETLRQNVTSPKGTTEAALNVLMNGKFQDIMDEAVRVATKRGEELAD